MTGEAARFDLASFLDEAIDAVVPRARDKGLVVSVLLPKLLPQQVAGDASGLRQILLELLDNAVRFTSRGQVELRVDCRGRNAQSVVLHFAVRDTGVGVGAEERARFTAPFAAAGGANDTGDQVGTESGLERVRRLAHALGGVLEVVGVPGVGSEFGVTVRLALVVAPVAERSDDAASPPGPRPLDRAPR